MAHPDSAQQSWQRSAFLQQPVTRAGIGQLARRLARFVYTHNPLYAASAWMVFRGLRASFDTAGGPFNTSLLTVSLAGYILLLAITAYLVIRLGKVWDDARSLLMLIVLMFLGLSVTFDSVLVDRPALGAVYSVGGWIFAAVISEVLLRGIQLRLGLLLRLPYHALLALFFLYPLGLAPLLGNPDSPVLQWLLFGFAPTGAAILLTLLPAIRRGPGYVEDNGSPWPWPAFPWTLFGMLGLCVSLRAYYLCLSLHFVGYADSIFGPYFLVPLGFAAALLLLEGGLTSRSDRVTRMALWLPAVMVALATLGHRNDRVYRGFLQLFESDLGGSPLWVALLLGIGFYGFAVLRRVRYAGAALTSAMLLLAVVAPTTLDFDHLAALRPLPLAVIGGAHLVVGLWQRLSWRVLLGNCLLLAALTVALQGTRFTAAHGAVPVNLLLANFLVVGFWFDDEVSRIVRRLGALLAVALVWVVISANHAWLGDFDVWIRAFYPLLLAGTVACYGWLLGDRWCQASALVSLGVSIVVFAARGYEQLRPLLIGLDQLSLGVLFFVLAALISLSKAGWLRLRLRPGPAPAAIDVGTPDGP
ncbi:MAG TPA: hypothetical protein VGG30_04435 [Pirellulales bacterium]|jgi:hypothetical protein